MANESLPSLETCKLLLSLDQPNQSTIGAAMRVFQAYVEGKLVPSENFEPLLEAAEEARNVLRDQYHPGEEEWSLSWGLEGALLMARGKDPLTGQPLGLPPLRDLPVGAASHIIREAFKVETLPDGALPVYSSESEEP